MTARNKKTSCTILVAEDHVGVRALAGRVLRSRGYEVLEAADGAEALDLLHRYPRPIHLLLTDWCMPRMSGSELCRQLRDRRPETRILVMSGYLGDHPQPAAAFLQKPFSAPDLVRMVEQVLASALKPSIPAASRNS